MSRPAIVAADPAGIQRAAAALAAGELVAFPTETVYGLGADATDDKAVAAIFAAKNRPDFNPLIVHVADIEAARQLVSFTPMAEALAAAFWPGPMSLVLPRRADCPLSMLVSAGLETAAVRVPGHALARELLVQADKPIAAPSANRSGEISPTTAGHVAQSFAAMDDAFRLTILDGGPCAVGLESSVIDATGNTATLLRPGGLAAEDIEAVCGPLRIAASDNKAPRSPGMLSRHYAPQSALRLNATTARADEILLGFGEAPPGTRYNLSPSANATEAAANLFAMLHAIDAERPNAIAVMPMPDAGLGRAINDRLRRAATPAD